VRAVRRPNAVTLLALAAGLVGGVGIWSALTPELAGRFDLVRGVLPPGVPETARILALAFGLALVWLSRSLARRKRRAWQLTVALVAGSVAAHLAKGLDFEEALFGSLVLAALWRYRGRFTAPGEPTIVAPLLRALAGLVAIGVLSALDVWENTRGAERIEEASGLLAAVLATRVLYLWLRPVAHRARACDEERAEAGRIVRERGHDRLAFFALRRDKSYFFSSSRSSFLAYRVLNGSALVAGDPIGKRSEFAELLSEFRRVAQAQAWRVAVVGASEALLPFYRSLGLRSVYLGDEALVRPREFSLEGRPIRKVRQSVTRLEAAGYRVRVVRGADAGDALRKDVEAVSAEWLGSWPERGFTMAMDSFFAHDDEVVAIAQGPDGEVGGFLQLVPSPASGGYSLAAMRRRRSTPNGLMEFLIAKTIEWAGAQEISELSLNFSVFADHLRAGGRPKRRRELVRFLLLRLDFAFQLERLFSFNRKFLPEWRRRYICVERLTDFPIVGLAYLHAESLLTPPGPWVRATSELVER
jgi:lysyl-tRNA synthetase class 2